MFCLWNLYLLLSVSLPLSAFTGEGDEETRRPDFETAARRGSPVFGLENVDFPGLPLSWPSSSSEQFDRQGVIGEYADLQESTETTAVYLDEKGPGISGPADGAAEDATNAESLTTTSEQHTLNNESAETKNGSFLQSAQTRETQSASPTVQNEMVQQNQPYFPLSGSPDQDFSSPPPTTPGSGPEQPTALVVTGDLGWTTNPSLNSQGKMQEGTASVKEAGDGVSDTAESLHTGAVSKVDDTGESHTQHLPSG